jgi:hypothetical protein
VGTEAKTKLIDENFTWKFDAEYSRFVASLVNTNAEMIGEDVEVTLNLPFLFGIDQADTAVFSLVTRPLSRGVVADCFRSARSSSNAAITGSPGIGKSWTLLYALQQALLHENACVVLVPMKLGGAFLCVRANSNIYVWTTREKDVATISTFLLLSDALFLLDPRDVKNEDTKYSTVHPCMLILAASNNDKHFQDLSKQEGQRFRYLGPWTTNELTVALPYMVKDLVFDVNQAIDWAAVVGNLPRYLRTRALYETRKTQTDATLRNVRAKDSVVDDILDSQGMTADTKSNTPAAGATIAGTIFSVCAERETVGDDGELFAECNYDGTVGFCYASLCINIMSQYVIDQVVQSNRRVILSFWGKVTGEDRISMGKAVENLFWADLCKATEEVGKFKMTRYMLTKGDKKGIESILTNDTIWVKNEAEIDLKDLVLTTTNEIYRMEPNTPTIDFAGPGRIVYQVTVSDCYDMNVGGLTTILVQGGYLVNGKSGYRVSTNTKLEKKKLQLHWVIPEQIQEKWITKIPRKYQQGTAQKDVLNQCLDKFVDQYALIMKNDD